MELRKLSHSYSIYFFTTNHSRKFYFNLKVYNNIFISKSVSATFDNPNQFT